MNHLLFIEAVQPAALLVWVLIIIGIVMLIRRLIKSKYNDIITLKNGSIIHGRIIEQNPNVSIKVETKDRNIMVYKNEEIEKITKN